MAFHSISNCEKNRDLVLMMVKNGSSLTKIAKAVSTNRRHVKSFLKKNGIDAKFQYGSPGPKHPSWKGGESISRDGYRYVYAPEHPNRDSHGRIRKSRLVMSEHLGRPLEKGEVVHHKNGNTLDDRIENLELFSANSEHLRTTLVGRCPRWTEDGIRRMKEGIARAAMLRRPETHIRSGSDVREWR